MGTCMSTESEESRKSAMIDKKIEDDAKRTRRECKILLLGEDDKRGWELLVPRSLCLTFR
jgi:guanine nucleotide-binding protein G(i) subunit alpha